jgi:hypothetical protein
MVSCLGAVLLVGCMVHLPKFSAQDLAAAPTSAVLGGISITVKGGARNDDQPRLGSPPRPTVLTVVLKGDRALPDTITVLGIYAAAGDTVRSAVATDRQVDGKGQLQFLARVSQQFPSESRVNVAALVTDGTSTVLVRDDAEVTVSNVQ